MSGKLRLWLLAFTLLGGALGGMSMPPEEIEELFQAHNQQEIVEVSESEEPDEAGRLLQQMGLVRVEESV